MWSYCVNSGKEAQISVTRGIEQLVIVTRSNKIFITRGEEKQDYCCEGFSDFCKVHTVLTVQ